MTLTLEIPFSSPSLNALVGRGTHWVYRAERQKWARRVNDAYLDQRAKAGRLPGTRFWPRPPRQVVHASVDRLTPGPLLDDDNFRGGLKVVIDALKDVQLIDDDNADALVMNARQVLTSREPGKHPRWTLITLSIGVTASEEREHQ